MALLPLLILVTIPLANTSPRTNDLSGSVELLGIDSNSNNRRGQQHPHRQRLLVFDGKYFDSKTNAEPMFRTRTTPSPAPTSDSSPTPSLNNILADNNNNNGPNSNSRKQQQQTGAEETTKLPNSSTSTTARITTNGTKYKVIRVVPENEGHLKLLERLELNGADLELNFWTSPIRIKAGVDIMLPAEKVPLLRRYLHKHRMHTEIIIDDVEQLIIQRERQIASSRRRAARLLADDPLAGGGDGIHPTIVSADHSNTIDFYHYNSYAQMVAWMRSLAKRYPKFVQFISVGKSHEGRAIDGLEIGSRGFRKRAFWIDGGIHAREWAAPHTALYFIHQLTSRYGHDEDITRLVNEITWIVVPLLNPDGYEYTRSSTNPNIRLWRKNRSPTHCVRDQWGRQRCCKGVDLNRNFDFHFKESGSSDDPCSEIYQGKNAFSEPEAKAVRDAILSNRYRGRIDGFITLHTYSQIWIHPYGHKRDSYPGDVQDLYAVGKKATAALTRLYGTKYVIGSGADTLYPASGGSEDWAKESANIKFVYLLELRPDEKNWDGFILDETQLIPTATETWAGVRVVADAIIQRARARRVATGSGNVAATMHRIAGLPQYQPLGTVVVTNDDLRQQQQQIPMQILSKEDASSSPNVVATGFGEWPTKSATRDGEEDTMKPQQQQQKKCTDRRRACRRWVMESEQICQAVPVFMGEQCARSCGFC